MEVTIHFPEQVGQQLLQRPDRDAFVSQAVPRALEDGNSIGGFSHAHGYLVCE